MSHEIICKNCKWSTGFQEPSKPMPVERPDTFLERWFGSYDVASDFIRIAHYRHNNLVECQRFPRRETMKMGDVCGEFFPSTAPEGDKQ